MIRFGNCIKKAKKRGVSKCTIKLKKNARQYMIAELNLRLLKEKEKELGIACIVRDITDEVKQKEEIIRSKENIKQVNLELNNYLQVLEGKNLELKIAKEDINNFNKQLETKVKQRTIELEEANIRISNLLKLKNEFFTRVAHDLRTPITSISLVLPLLAETKKDKANNKMLDIVKRNVGYLSDLINDTINITKADMGKLKLDLINNDLNEILEAALNINYPELKQNKIKITKKINKKTTQIKCDKLKFSEVIQNIITNFMKYGSDGKKLFIQSKTIDQKEIKKIISQNKIRYYEKINQSNDQANYSLISFKDYGAGLKKEYQESIFSDFFKADQSRHSVNGFGLGLSICRRILDQHKGFIWAESKGSNKGTTFFIAIPQIQLKTPKLTTTKRSE